MLIFITPAVFAWIAVRGVSPAFYQTDNSLRLPLWIAQALIVSLVVARAFAVIAQKLVPLTSLLSLTLVFPDQAPSRFGTALRAGATKKLKATVHTLPKDEGEAAREAITLITAFNKHDRLTRGHIERVRAYGEMIGTEMGLADEDLNKLRWGLILHDVGKLSVPSEILQKEGRPTKEEWEVLKTHPAMGADFLEPLTNFLGPWIGAANHHHERWDGTGYPNGLSGTDISLAGRICSVADAYDVITSKRSYKNPQPIEFARKELVDNAGTQFDPVIVRAFLQAGIRNTSRAGFLGWLLELPQTLGIASVASVPAATVAGAMAATAITLSTIAPSPTTAPPPQIAFEQPAVVVEQPPAETTTTTGPITTLNTPTTTPVIVTGPPLTSPESIFVPSTVTTTSITPATTTSTTPATTTSITSTVPVTTTPTITSTVPATTTPIIISPTSTTTTTTTAAPITTTAAPPTTTAAPPTTTTPTTTSTTTAPTTTTTSTTTTTPPPPPVTGTGFQLSTVAQVPVLPVPTRSNTAIVIPEQEGFILPTDITLVNYPTLRDPGFGEPTNANEGLDAGDVVCVWLVQIQPSTLGVAVVEMTFDQEILGIDHEPRFMTFFENPAIVYNFVADIGPTDHIENDSTTVYVEFGTGTSLGADGFRVVTSC